ncbi:MAG: hypothetical protein OES13_06520 [Acidimicrobiia bacterium]|nr:hypothetical protein [Acidimicrobiia bacterium]
MYGKGVFHGGNGCDIVFTALSGSEFYGGNGLDGVVIPSDEALIDLGRQYGTPCDFPDPPVGP